MQWHRPRVTQVISPVGPASAPRTKMMSLQAMLTESNASLLALAAVIVAMLSSWAYEYVTMPAEQKNARKLRRFAGLLPILGDTLTLWRNLHRFHDICADNAKNGGGAPMIARFLGCPPVIKLVTPQHLEDVQKTHFDCFVKGRHLQEGLGDLLGDGIFIADGDNWVHQRKTAVNLLSSRMLRDQMGQTVYRLMGIVHNILQKAQIKNEQLDLMRLMSRFTIQAFAEHGFGVDFNCLETVEDHPFQRAFDRSQEILVRRFAVPPWFWKLQRWANLGAEKELKSHMKVINDMVYDIISKSLIERSAGVTSSKEEKKADIISVFLDNEKMMPDGTIESFDPKFLRDITINFLGAARDTTAVSLSWFFYALTNHPEIERKLRQELWEKLPELMNGQITAPSLDQLHDLVYLEAVVKETLRIYPPVSSNLRTCKKSVVLSDGTFIPEGYLVTFSNYTLGRMDYIWGPDAEEFKPERWIDEATGKLKVVSAFKFNAFLAGPHICIGMQLAMSQIKMVASSLLSRFHFEREAKEPMTYEISITLMMKDPFMVRVLPASALPAVQ